MNPILNKVLYWKDKDFLRTNFRKVERNRTAMSQQPKSSFSCKKTIFDSYFNIIFLFIDC